MDPVTVYGIAAGGIALTAFLYSTSSHISRWIQDRTFFYVFKYLIYPIFLQRNRLFAPLSRWHALLMMIYWSGTVACNLVGVATISQAGKRAGALAALHLVPLLFTNRPSFAADLLGISVQSYLKLHGSLGLMTFLQSLIHIVIFLTRNTFRIGDPLQFYGFLGAVAIASLMLLSTLRIPLFEFFQKTHYALAILTAYAIWRHLSIKPAVARIYIIVAGFTFCLTTIARYSRLVVRNVVWRQPYTATKLVGVQDVIRVQVTPARPWKIRAGQYVYIWMPGVSFWSPFQSHPFMISWWEHDIRGRGTNIYLLVKPASGFTQKLLRHAGICGLKALVDGPYGELHDIGDYGSVVMFASGIGIAAQVPYIKELLKGFQEYTVRTKSILLVWQLDKESDEDWVQDWMTQLLSEDKGSYVLRITLYVLRNFNDEQISYGQKEQYGHHERIKKLYGRPHLEKIIKSEIDAKRGRLVITTSTECNMQDQIQRLAHKYLDKDIKLIHLAFQPQGSRGFWAPKPPEVKYEGVV